MGFEHDRPTYFNRDLCSVEIFAPTQIQHADDSFGLMANAWFGAIREDVPTKDGLRTLTIGLHTATLVLETCDESRISPQNRYRSALLTLTYIALNEIVSQHERQGSFGGAISVPLLNAFKLKAGGDISGGKNAKGVEKLNQDTTFDLYEVDGASPLDWSIEALNPARPKPHLKGPELREVTLCAVETPHGSATITARLSISAMDLWLDVNDGEPRRRWKTNPTNARF